jgi:hypothetical protein
MDPSSHTPKRNGWRNHSTSLSLTHTHTHTHTQMRILKSSKRFLSELHPPNHPVTTSKHATTHGISCSDHRGNLKRLSLSYYVVLTLGTSCPYSAVSIVTRLRQRQDSFILFKTFTQDLGPPSLLLKGQRYSLSGVKRPGREAEQSPPSSAEVTNEWIYAPTPPVCMHGGDRESFTFTRWAASFMSDILPVTWHYCTFCRSHLIIRVHTLCVQFMYS